MKAQRTTTINQSQHKGDINVLETYRERSGKHEALAEIVESSGARCPSGSNN